MHNARRSRALLLVLSTSPRQEPRPGIALFARHSSEGIGAVTEASEPRFLFLNPSETAPVISHAAAILVPQLPGTLAPSASLSHLPLWVIPIPSVIIIPLPSVAIVPARCHDDFHPRAPGSRIPTQIVREPYLPHYLGSNRVPVITRLYHFRPDRVNYLW